MIFRVSKHPALSCQHAFLPLLVTFAFSPFPSSSFHQNGGMIFRVNTRPAPAGYAPRSVSIAWGFGSFAQQDLMAGDMVGIEGGEHFLREPLFQSKRPCSSSSSQ